LLIKQQELKAPARVRGGSGGYRMGNRTAQTNIYTMGVQVGSELNLKVGLTIELFAEAV
jgi:hypothetical protein